VNSILDWERSSEHTTQTQSIPNSVNKALKLRDVVTGRDYYYYIGKVDEDVIGYLNDTSESNFITKVSPCTKFKSVLDDDETYSVEVTKSYDNDYLFMFKL
jgi:hypothetical protein